MLKQWDKGQQVILEANPDYYGEAPIMKKVTILFMEEDAAYAAVMSGQADLAYTAASYSDQTLPGYELLAFETVDNRDLTFLPCRMKGRQRTAYPLVMILQVMCRCGGPSTLPLTGMR